MTTNYYDPKKFRFIVDDRSVADDHPVFSASVDDAAQILTALSCYWHGDSGKIEMDDKVVWQGLLLVGGTSSLQDFLDDLA